MKPVFKDPKIALNWAYLAKIWDICSSFWMKYKCYFATTDVKKVGNFGSTNFHPLRFSNRM